MTQQAPPGWTPQGPQQQHGQHPGYGPNPHQPAPQAWPQQQARPKSNRTLYIVLGVIGGFFLLSMCGGIMSAAMSKSAQQTAQTEPSSAAPAVNPAAPNRAEEEPEKPKARTPKLNEWFKLGEFTYLVKSVQVAGTVGTGFAKKTASDGAVYVLVSFMVRNEGSETETVLTDDFRIVDAKDREYHPSSDANTALVMSGGKDLALTELQPGLKKAITTGFEVPKSAVEDGFTLVIPEKGVFGTGSVRIALKRGRD